MWKKWERFRFGNKAVGLEVSKRGRVGKVEGLRWGAGKRGLRVGIREGLRLRKRGRVRGGEKS